MEDEGLYRFLFFAGIFLLMGFAELIVPKRLNGQRKFDRWLTNISIGGIDSFLIRLLGFVSIPIVAVGAALFAEDVGFGLFHLIQLPGWLEVIVAFVILDFAIYLQHVASHKIPILWNVHQVHHSDTHIDVTTAVRFHPIEIGLSMLYKVIWVFVFGIDVFAVLLFEISLNGFAMFNHANVALPKGLDRILRLIIVTPDMHRVHHSIKTNETDSNYGFNLAIWDRMFKTYIPQPKDGHTKMLIGLSSYRGANPSKFLWSISLPFRNNKDD